MKLFENPQSIAGEVNQMERDEFNRREDRQLVSDFFHGAPPYSDQQAADLGLTVNVNNLFGYKDLSDARDQLLSLYTTPPRLWEVELDQAPPQLKKAWEAKATLHWNRIMKSSGRLKHGYEFAAGDATMHGEGFFWFPNTVDWCPQQASLARRLVPSKATMDVNALTHWTVSAELKFQDLVRHKKQGSKGWKQDNLQIILKRIFDSKLKESGGDARVALDQQNPEMMAYYRQANMATDRLWAYSLPVKYFFQCNFDHPTQAFDLTVMADDAVADANGSNKVPAGQAVLFERESYFPTIQQTMFPMFMNAALGGEPLWHRVKGYGHLNYSLNWHLECMMSRAIQAVHEQGTTFFQASDSASREAMEQIILQHNGIIPEGINMVQSRVGGDFQGFLAMMQMMRQRGAENVNTIAPNNGQNDALQVQAIFQQNSVASAVTNRVSHWFDYMNRLGREVWRRFTNPLVMKDDKGDGISEILKFQAAMQKEGIPLKYLQPNNCHITTSRVVGDGNRQQAQAKAQAMMSSIQIYGPAAQQDIKRMFAAAVTDDYSLAEKWVPYDEEPDADQVTKAMEENAICIVTGKAPPIRDADQDVVHVQIHMDQMGEMVKTGVQEQQMHFTPQQMKGFVALGGHIAMHIKDRIQPVNKELAAKMLSALNEITQMGQKLANNLVQQQQKQQQEGQEKPMTQAEIVAAKQAQQKIDQNQQKIEIGVKKHEDSQELRSRQQELREQEAASRQHLSLTKDIRDDRMIRQEMAIADAEAAAGLAPAPEQEEAF